MQEYETNGHITVGHPRRCWENLSCVLTPGLSTLIMMWEKVISKIQYIYIHTYIRIVLSKIQYQYIYIYIYILTNPVYIIYTGLVKKLC